MLRRHVYQMTSIATTTIEEHSKNISTVFNGQNLLTISESF